MCVCLRRRRRLTGPAEEREAINRQRTAAVRPCAPLMWTLIRGNWPTGADRQRWVPARVSSRRAERGRAWRDRYANRPAAATVRCTPTRVGLTGASISRRQRIRPHRLRSGYAPGLMIRVISHHGVSLATSGTVCTVPELEHLYSMCCVVSLLNVTLIILFNDNMICQSAS